MNFAEKVKHSKELIAEHLQKYPNSGVAVSWGKDSMAVLHLALQVDPKVHVFSVLTRYKPKETFSYKEQICNEWNLDVKVYMNDDPIEEGLYKTNPDACCKQLKVEPTKEAVKNLDCWICGLRNTEGRTRKDYKEVEDKNGLIKLNPILTWTEREVWQYLAINQFPIHPWYARGYRSLGCEPCTHIVGADQTERDGRWLGTSKCGGECGIHTQQLK